MQASYQSSLENSATLSVTVKLGCEPGAVISAQYLRDRNIFWNIPWQYNQNVAVREAFQDFISVLAESSLERFRHSPHQAKFSPAPTQGARAHHTAYPSSTTPGIHLAAAGQSVNLSDVEEDFGRASLTNPPTAGCDCGKLPGGTWHSNTCTYIRTGMWASLWQESSVKHHY